jgi:uncharacterized membrane-anchored protein YhcB (DUF1043 family)
MEYRDIAIGVVIGVLIGATAIFMINQSKISRLNKASEDLETVIDSLNEALDAKQAIIDAQEDAIGAVAALEAEIDAKDSVIEGYEVYQESAEVLIAELTLKVDQLNVLYAEKVYRAEEALTLLHDYLPEYEPKINFSAVYGDLSFEEWWEINGGPPEEWLSLVYG